MQISLIAAVGRNRAIGLNKGLPWYLPEDLRNFKKITLGHHLLMGRKTFETMSKPLPGRTNMIATAQKGYAAPPDCLVVHDLVSGFQLAEERGEAELFVVGGAQIYELALPYANRFYVSHVDYDGPADTFFPAYENFEWQCILRADFSGWSYEVLEKAAKPWKA